MYRFGTKQEAEQHAQQMRTRCPEHRFEVAAHSWTPTGQPLTWGVCRWVRRCGTLVQVEVR